MFDDMMKKLQEALGHTEPLKKQPKVTKGEIKGDGYEADVTMIGPFSGEPDIKSLPKDVQKQIAKAAHGAALQAFKNQLRDGACVAMLHGRMEWAESEDQACKVGGFRMGPDKAVAMIAWGTFEDGQWSVLPMFLADKFLENVDEVGEYREELETLLGQVKAAIGYLGDAEEKFGVEPPEVPDGTDEE